MANFFAKLWDRLSPRQQPMTVMIVGLDDSGKTSILEILLKNPASRTGKKAGKERDGSFRETSQERDRASPTPSQVGGRLTHSLSTTFGAGLSLGDPREARDGHQREVQPTVGYNYERIKYRNQILNVLDFSGQSKYRGLWQEFYCCVDAIVFVIDSSDMIRFVVARDELETLLEHPHFATLASEQSAISLVQSKVQSAAAQKQIIISQGKLIIGPLNDSLSASSQKSPANVTTSSARSREKIPILFLANKSDLNNSASKETIVEALKLDAVNKLRHPWLIQETSVDSNQGVVEGFDWLLAELLNLSWCGS